MFCLFSGKAIKEGIEEIILEELKLLPENLDQNTIVRYKNKELKFKPTYYYLDLVHLTDVLCLLK